MNIAKHSGVTTVSWVVFWVLMTALPGQDQPQGQAAPPTAPATKNQAKGATPAQAQAKKPAGASQPSASPSSKKPAATKAQVPRPGAEVDVRIRTRAEMDKPKSQFVGTPGGSPQDRYGPDAGVDWSEIPAWRQTSFFGLRARGQFFVYVVDCSGSMIDDDRMPRATIELRRSVNALREPQRFEVIFYNSESIPLPGGPIPRTADEQAKNLLRSFLRLVEPDGGTDPRLAMKQALSLRPDAVFLLSDGAYPSGTVEEITRLNTHNIPIHCVDLAGGLEGDHLKRIALANNGQYASRMGDLQGRP